MYCSYSFKESYHGKGPHDGIGAACKRKVWNYILRGQSVAENAK
jgi:hypothetical protein